MHSYKIEQMTFYFSSLAEAEKDLKIYFKIKGGKAIKTVVKHDFLGYDAPVSILFETPEKIETPIKLQHKGIQGLDLKYYSLIL